MVYDYRTLLILNIVMAILDTFAIAGNGIVCYDVNILLTKI